MEKARAIEARGAVPLLREGETCWRKGRAERLAFLVDTAAYFRAVKRAALKARRSILIVGWDVNSRTPLEFPEQADPTVPNRLGPFLDDLADRRAGLEIRVLVWDSPRVYAPDREWLPKARFDWLTHPRLGFALDTQHPFGASHHQKLVVIDDRLAFVGGTDLTGDRLDDPGHRAEDPRRVKPDGTPYGPYHDVTAMVDGPAAAALGELARMRWLRATGEQLAWEAGDDCWPDEVAPDLAGVEVGIARTDPAWKGRPELREIERLYLECIGRAEHTLYIENQYFTAQRIAQAIRERLAQPDCPEIVMVVPPHATGWLEQTTMGSRQRMVLAHLRDADRRGRFRVYTPVVGEAGEVGVKVHAKLMVVDDRLVVIGSANLNNRSMGLDTELSLAVEAGEEEMVAEAITRLRDRLLAEHLDVTPERVAAELAGRGSLIEEIERLRGPGRSLARFPEVSPDRLDEVLTRSRLFDPDAPAEPERIADAFASDRVARTTLRRGMVQFAAVILALLALAALWRWGPLSGVAAPEQLQAWGEAVRRDWLATAAVLAAYVIGGLAMLPVTALIAATGLLYGPLAGLIVAFSGSLLSAATGYGLGWLAGRRHLERLAGGRLDRISRQLARRGILSMTVVRLLPIAPFTLVNLAAGASHIRLRDFLAGTVLGMAPGIVAIALFSGQLARVLVAPDALGVGVLAGLVLVIGAAAAWAWRRFLRRVEGAGDE